MKVREIEVSYSNQGNKKVTVKNSETVFEVALAHWDKNIIEYQEEVKLMLLNRANVILGIYDLSKGGVASCSVDLKIILSIALKGHASSIVLLHNHPSGKLEPSNNDKIITKKLKKACSYLDLVLLDHLIITKNSFYSFNDNNIL
ncbi:JAB domain-containing protein [Kordia algicida OT-1]|uniref:Putative DNA repair protein n=1 Tax=Kordia algicida OT-1 TaxID=391587 RepID=A9DPR3_9FLAO|nr:JAB domain-containing protein [Kordia algicida]EDP97499.1 putative DNA repair protein [Kordia algicida OT-1]